MRKFTFDDWLEDRLTGKEFTVMGENSLPMILYFASKDPEILIPEDYKMIRQYQNEAYDIALEMTLKTYKQVYLIESSRATDKEGYLKLEIAKIEKELNKDIQRWQQASTGAKDTNGIKGSTYKRVKNQFDQLIEGRLSAATILESELYPYSLQVKYLDWLNDQTGSEQRAKKKREGQKLTYIELFKPPFNTEPKQKELFTILLTNEYVNESGEWNRKKEPNQFAALYHCLKKKAFNPIKVAPSIPIFGQRFNLTFGNDERDFCVIRSITTDPGFTETRLVFDRILSNW